MGKKITINIDGKEIGKDELKKRFKAYNDLYFNGKLGECDFSFFSKNTSYLGWYNSRNDKNGKPKDKIWIGTCVKWIDESLERIMVHEMVHMYVYRIKKCKLDGLLGHGRRFRRKCRLIKNDYGIDVLTLPKVEFLDKKFLPKPWEKVLLWLIDR